jgi:hypothetical protein
MIVISRSFRIGMAKKAGPNKATSHAGGASSRLHRVPALRSVDEWMADQLNNLSPLLQEKRI